MRLFVLVPLLTVVALVLSASEALAVDVVRCELVVDSYEEFDAAFRDVNIDVLTSRGDVMLVPFTLLYDETGKRESLFSESLSKTVWAKKELYIPDSRVRWSDLYYFKHSDTMSIKFNGHELTERETMYGTWGRAKVPVEYLRQGINEVIFSGGGTLGIENSLWPNRSAKSVDGGATWNYDVLGSRNQCNGEYIVRLGLGGYPSAGIIWSDAVDLASLAGSGPVVPRVRVLALSAHGVCETPQGTSVEIQVRAGKHPFYTPEDWTPWTSEPMSGFRRPIGRYMQWRAILRTDNSLATPVLKAVTVRTTLAVSDSPHEGAIEVVTFENHKILRSSYNFTYQAPTRRLQVLRDNWHIEDVVAGAENELEKFVHIRDWTRHQWDDGWDMGLYDYCPPLDAIMVLDWAPQNKSLGMCGHYACVFIQSCLSLGYTARDVCGRAHGFAEVWSNEHERWITMDAGPATDDEAELNYHYEQEGIPMNTLELHRAYLAGDYSDIDVVPSDPANDWEPSAPENADQMLRYEFIWTFFRNNQLDSPIPGEIVIGMDYETDTGALFWKDGIFSDMPHFPFQTYREEDMYWTLNQTEMDIQYGSEPGTLLLTFDTVTPNFTSFIVRTDDDEWRESEWKCVWRLHEGVNTLEAATVNAFGVRGIVSRIVLRYEPSAD